MHSASVVVCGRSVKFTDDATTNFDPLEVVSRRTIRPKCFRRREEIYRINIVAPHRLWIYGTVLNLSSGISG